MWARNGGAFGERRKKTEVGEDDRDRAEGGHSWRLSDDERGIVPVLLILGASLKNQERDRVGGWVTSVVGDWVFGFVVDVEQREDVIAEDQVFCVGGIVAGSEA